MPELSEAEVDPDPFVEFRRWFEAARAAGVADAHAMALATVGRDGRPSVRFVLLRGFDERGFVFYTSYDSRKGRELDENPWAALAFYWPALHRQVRVEGRVERVSEAESDAYWRTRPRGSQLAAWAATQSEPVPDRAFLERRMAELEHAYADRPVPRPPRWGGYRVVPATIELWQSRPNRLHDRLVYRRQSNGAWLVERLAP